MRFNKKGSLDISIQAIVIVVIAFVVLGLGLGFVKSTFKDITETSKGVQAKIKEQILEDLRVSGKKVSITSQVTIERGKETLENVGVVNTGLTEKTFGIKISFIKKQNPDGSPGPEGAENDPLEIGFFYSGLVDKSLSPTAGDVFPITISAKSTAAGNYLYKVDVLAESTPGACATGEVSGGCESYDTRSFFVRVG